MWILINLGDLAVLSASLDCKSSYLLIFGLFWHKAQGIRHLYFRIEHTSNIINITIHKLTNNKWEEI